MFASSAWAGTSAAPWWEHAVIYEVYIRSFQDSNGDGVGDLRGVTQRLDYLAALGVDAVWLTPFFPSPNADFGYDVSDYRGVAPEYGTLSDFDDLVREAKARGIRVLVDFVLNHTSDQHPWFVESRASRDNPRRDWYVWREGQVGSLAPTNWRSIFGGPSWTFDSTTGQWYYHVFLPQQPDLNWSNPEVRSAMYDVARFWLDRGVGGFRLDATPYLFEDPTWPADPHPEAPPPAWFKPYNSDRPENHEVMRELRHVLDGYEGAPVLLAESATTSIESLSGVYGKFHDEIQLPMDFLIGNMTILDARELKRQVDDAETRLAGNTPVLFFSSHDHSRQYTTFADGRHDEAIAKLSAAVTLLPRGCAVVYYGEEIGMGNLDERALKDAPLGPRRPRADERDRERAPMQWSGERNAGFSTGDPWLPVSADSARHNATDQAQQRSSILRWYQALIRLRRETRAFREGAYWPLETTDSHVYAFARVADSDHAAIVLMNVGGGSTQVRTTGWPARPPRLGRLLEASGLVTSAADDTWNLGPYAVAVAEIRWPWGRPRVRASSSRVGAAAGRAEGR